MIRYIRVVSVDLQDRNKAPTYKVVKERYNSISCEWVRIRNLKYTNKNIAKCH